VVLLIVPPRRMSSLFVEDFPDSLPYRSLDYRFMLTRIAHLPVSDLAPLNRVASMVNKAHRDGTGIRR